jgi:hypothetical protein
MAGRTGKRKRAGRRYDAVTAMLTGTRNQCRRQQIAGSTESQTDSLAAIGMTGTTGRVWWSASSSSGMSVTDVVATPWSDTAAGMTVTVTLWAGTARGVAEVGVIGAFKQGSQQ